MLMKSAFQPTQAKQAAGSVKSPHKLGQSFPMKFAGWSSEITNAYPATNHQRREIHFENFLWFQGYTDNLVNSPGLSLPMVHVRPQERAGSRQVQAVHETFSVLSE
jgi:hypothetical protein